MDKKGDLGWEEIARIILVVVFLVILILITTLYKDKLLEVIEKIKDLIRFGK